MPDSVDRPAPESTMTPPAATRSATAASAVSSGATGSTSSSSTRPVCPLAPPPADARRPPRLLGLGLGRAAHDAPDDLPGRQAVVHRRGHVLDDRHVDVVRAGQLED